MSTRFCVYAKDGTAVEAKYLEIDGRVIRDASGNPYYVPADFSGANTSKSLKSFGTVWLRWKKRIGAYRVKGLPPFGTPQRCTAFC